MSEKFSVEDILNEVKAMTGDHYYNNEPKHKLKSEPAEETKADDSTFKNQAEKTKEEIKGNSVENEVNPFKKDESFLPEDIDNNDTDDDREELDISKMSTEEFFNMLETGSSEKIKTVDESEPKEIIKEEKIEEEVQNFEENLENTVVYDKKELEEAIEESKEETISQAEEISVEPSEEESVEAKDLGGLKIKHSHNPAHLLKPEEIINNSMNEAPSFRFSDRVKDLTKTKKAEKSENNAFTPFKRPEETVKADEFIDKVNEKFEKEEKEKAEPDTLNNEVRVGDESEIAVPFADQIEVKKEITDKELERNTDKNKAYAKKTMRRITETSFDYSDDNKNEEEVIDDYTTIDDEEPVRSDLDLSVGKITKRLTLNIIAFVIAFLFGILPGFDINLISAVSPSENLTGFFALNAAILLITLIINISSFFRGLGALVTFRPDSDSPTSVAALFVIAGTVISFVPQFSAAAGKIPFFTATLIFSYILSLIGKKSMVTRIRSNFRLVATTTPKQACFVADERLSEMLENDDFIGIPDVAVSKSVLNLHNYLKNSYCEDPSDNIARIFAPLSLIAAAATFIITFILSSDIVSSLFYSTAVALLCVPASVILAVNAPLKKASYILRHREGLISGYNAVNEFSNVDCVAIDAEDLFPAGSVELLSLRAIGDASIEDIILKSAALTINAGGPLADVFDKIIDGRRKMLPPISDIIYEDGLGLSGKVEGKTVRIGNRNFIDSYGIYGLSDDSIEQKAKKGGFFIVYTAVDDEVCGMFAVKYKSIDPDIEDALYELVNNNITIALKTNDPNITPELIEKVFEIPSDYVVLMEAHTAEHYDELTKPSKNGDGILAYSGNSSAFAMLITACKKLQKKISLAVLLQTILTVLGFGTCLISVVLGKGTEFITPLNIIVYQFVAAIISHIFPALIKRIK